jgi:branched-chain amino acid aminotransferase
MIYPLDRGENFFLLNDKIYSTKNFNPNLLLNGEVIYEVLRVVGTKPIFLQEHLERLFKSCSKTGIECPTFDKIKENILKLLTDNPVNEKNLKISIIFDPIKVVFLQLIAYFIDSHYPPQSDYQNGVKLELLSMERKNPNVKLENPEMRGIAEKMICISQTSEVLLIDENGNVTEGSRSNFFAVKNKALYTAPSSRVLEGITRSKVLDLSQIYGIPMHFSLIHSTELNQFEGAFITGTSSKVLPIKRIGDLEFNPQEPTIRRIMNLYDELVNGQLVD